MDKIVLATYFDSVRIRYSYYLTKETDETENHYRLN